jgi:hypothetical protein
VAYPGGKTRVESNKCKLKKKERRSHLRRVGSLKSRIPDLFNDDHACSVNLLYLYCIGRRGHTEKKENAI